MSKLSNRIEKLESIAESSKLAKWIRVIQRVDQTRAQALKEAGIVNPEAHNIWYVTLVSPKGA